MRPDDRNRILAAKAYTSEETYARRFHQRAHHFSDWDLTYLTEVDGDNHIALIATECEDPDRLVAIARCVRNPAEPHDAELAITVHDPYQRRGIGFGMLSLLHDAAVAHGITQLRAFIESDNDAMVALMYKVFPRTRRVTKFGRTCEFLAELRSA